MLTQARLRELLNYDQDSGRFTWKVSRPRCKAGTLAGTPRPDGYIQISIDKKLHLAHRLAWLYVHGHFPPDQIDHRNSNRADNHLTNLRPATQQQNNFNVDVRSHNQLGIKGVCFRKDLKEKKFKAQISLNNRLYHLGFYPTAEQASDAYNGFAKLVHGEFYRPQPLPLPDWMLPVTQETATS